MNAMGVPQSTTLPRVIHTFEEFAKVDVFTGDIDPVYFAINTAREHFGYGWSTRFAVAMLTFYHTGTAAQAADFEGDEFWDFIIDKYPTAPRASERRHWRGSQGKVSLGSMMSFSPNPDEFFQKFDHTYSKVKRTCENHLKGFGAYFVLKICDYMDRCLGLTINDYTGLERNLPTLPAQAVKLLWDDQNDSTVPYNFLKTVDRLAPLGLFAPPMFDRNIGPAEVETILCDWKRAKYGNHIVGDDVLDKRNSLRCYGPKAERLIDMFPMEFPLTTFKCELR